MTYTVFQDTNVVKVIVTDVVTLQHCIHSVDDFLAGRKLPPGMQLLIDATNLTPAFSFDDLRDLAWHSKRLVEHGLDNIAIIATSDLVFGLARTFSAYADSQGFKVFAFRTQEKAAKWLEGCKLVAYPSVQTADS
jgi:hypothetical protein